MTPKTSYRTGTMTPPPPMPNRPARMPVTTPPARINSTSQTISPSGYPSSMVIRWMPSDRTNDDVRQIRGPVQHQRQRISHDGGPGARLDRFRRQMAPEGARARHRAEQPKHVPRDAAQPNAGRRLALDVRDERERGFFRRCEWRVRAEELWIDRKEPPRLLIGGTAHHDAVKRATFGLRLLEAGNAAIEDDLEIGMRGLEAMHQRVIERRHLAVLLRRQTLQPGLARVHDERIGARRLHASGEAEQGLGGVLIVDADAAFDGDGN